MRAKNTILKISGMSCASCAVSNEKELLKTKGILSASVNFAAKKAYIEYDADILSLAQVKKIIIDNGYQIDDSSEGVHKMKVGDGGHEHGKENLRKSWQAFLWSAILSVSLVFDMFEKIKLGIDLAGIDLAMWIDLVLATVVVFHFGWRFHRMAILQAKKFRANMDSLVSMGTLVAYVYSFWAMFSGKDTF